MAQVRYWVCVSDENGITDLEPHKHRLSAFKRAKFLTRELRKKITVFKQTPENKELLYTINYNTETGDATLVLKVKYKEEKE